MLPINIKNIIDLTLGDGWLGWRHQSDKFAHFDIMHCIEQIDYAKHKEQILNNMGYPTNGRITTDSRTNKLYYRFHTQQHPDFSAAYKHVYNGGKKDIDKHLLRDMDDKTLAYLYMDDGSSHRSNKSKKGNEYRIFSEYITIEYRLSVNSFSLKGINLLQTWLKDRYDIDTSLEPQFSSYRIIIRRVESKDKFKSIIEPYILDSMKYKIEKKHSFSGISCQVISGSQTERENSSSIEDDATVESKPSGA